MPKESSMVRARLFILPLLVRSSRLGLSHGTTSIGMEAFSSCVVCYGKVTLCGRRNASARRGIWSMAEGDVGAASVV